MTLLKILHMKLGYRQIKKLTKPELKEAKAELLELKGNDFKPFETTEFMNKYIDKMVAEIESDIDPDTWNVKVVPTMETTRLTTRCIKNSSINY